MRWDYKIIYGIVIVILWSLVCVNEAGIPGEIRQKRDNELSKTRPLQFLVGEGGLLENIFSWIQKRRQAADTGTKSTTSVQFLDNLQQTLRLFFANLVNVLDERRRNPGSKSFDVSKLGLCTPESCAEFFDRIRQSPLYRNLKQFTVLLQTEEGRQILRQILSDPKLLKAVLTGDNDAVAASVLGIGNAGNRPGSILQGNGSGTGIVTEGGGIESGFMQGSGTGIMQGSGTGNIQGSGSVTGSITGNIKPQINSTVDEVNHYDYENIFSEVNNSNNNNNNSDNSSQLIQITGSSRTPIDYSALYYDGDPKG